MLVNFGVCNVHGPPCIPPVTYSTFPLPSFHPRNFPQQQKGTDEQEGSISLFRFEDRQAPTQLQVVHRTCPSLVRKKCGSLFSSLLDLCQNCHKNDGRKREPLLLENMQVNCRFRRLPLCYRQFRVPDILIFFHIVTKNTATSFLRQKSSSCPCRSCGDSMHVIGKFRVTITCY